MEITITPTIASADPMWNTVLPRTSNVFWEVRNDQNNSYTHWVVGNVFSYLSAATVNEGANIVEKRFNELAQKWREETAGTSSPMRKLMNPNYLKVLKLGDEVVPFILRELSERPDDWFMLLKLLTDEDPVKAEERDNFKLVVRAWLNWGREKHFIA